MTNPEIARQFRHLAQLMEFHQDNPFKIRSYRNAYNKLRKLDDPLAGKSETELQELEGVGKAIAAKIHELATTGRMATLEKWREKTPEGIEEMLSVSGFGPKKVAAVHKGLGVTTVGQLLYAINENRLIELKGFGAKTQETLRQKLEFHQRSRGQFLYRDLEAPAKALLERFRRAHPEARTELTGALRRRCPVLRSIELLTTLAPADAQQLIKNTDDLPVTLYHCTPENFGSKQFRHTGSETFLKEFVAANPALDFTGLAEEQQVFNLAKTPYREPELRESYLSPLPSAASGERSLITLSDIRGVVHTHSTYSDGIHSVRQMAEAAIERGYEYLVMSDHSKIAVYANGLTRARAREQWLEIDGLNEELAPFRILKSIECDILHDGSLDYDDEFRAGFDLVIASVHAGLNMDETRATERLLTAIAHPHTNILGHPTGRLLLSRAGYPIDHAAILDACAEHGVAVELNANPYRLDLDWSWIPYAAERGVPVSINPDAHAQAGIDDIRYGVLAARKGGLTAAGCLNAQPLNDFLRTLGQPTT